jgi:acetyl-CoA C-acetyltransferase
MSDAYVLSAVRTPIGRYGGSLAGVPAVELARTAIAAALERAGLEPSQVDQTLLGMARQAGNGPNPGRQAAIRAGIPQERPAYTLNQACASGLLSISQARDLIRLGEADVVVAAGVESMSRVPYLLPAETARWGQKAGHFEAVDGMYRDGFFCPLSDQLMGRTAETLAQQHGITRLEQDELAVRSQRRAQDAIAAGRFDAEIVPVIVPGAKGSTTFAKDEHPRGDVTVEGMAKLAPVFVPASEGGTVHAGNSSGITDGAAALVVASEGAVARLGCAPLARIRAVKVVGVDPRIMGIGPVPATRELLASEKLTIDEIDLVELNEAFAAQVLACLRELPIAEDRLNVNGGAIALGHPIGCTGARIATTLLHEMSRRGSALGLATLCVSGGLGFSMLFERA